MTLKSKGRRGFQLDPLDCLIEQRPMGNLNRFWNMRFVQAKPVVLAGNHDYPAL